MATNGKSTPSVVCDADGVPTSIRIFKVGANLDSHGVNAIYDPSMATTILKAVNKADGTIDFDIGHRMLAGTHAPHDTNESVGHGKTAAVATRNGRNLGRWDPVGWWASEPESWSTASTASSHPRSPGRRWAAAR